MSDSGEEVPIVASETCDSIKISTKSDKAPQRSSEPQRVVTELSFLLDLLLTHKLPSVTRCAITERIKDVELSLNSRVNIVQYPAPLPAAHQAMVPRVNTGAPQSASMQALIDRNPDVIQQAPAPIPVQNIAQNAVTAAALAARQALINGAGKTEKGQVSPRKF